jgi:hypothetical protein
MAVNEGFDWRRSDRRLFALIAVLFPLVVLTGFGPTYYLKFAVQSRPVASTLVHIHGAVMTAWVLLFVAQVWLIRAKQARVHMKMGIAAALLAAAIIVSGFFTGVAAAKFGTPSAPPDIPPLAFMIVPLTDIVLFALFFGMALYYRKQPATHKRLMLLTVFNFLPPAMARFPFEWVVAAGPLFFFGVPTLAVLGFLLLDWRQTGKVNKPYLVGGLILIASYPLRIIISGTDAWLSFAGWLTTWAA